jgi:hypothetical protein
MNQVVVVPRHAMMGRDDEWNQVVPQKRLTRTVVSVP